MVVLFTVIVEQAVMHFLATDQPENQEQLLEKGVEVPLIFTLLVFGILGPIIGRNCVSSYIIKSFSHYIGTAIASIISIIRSLRFFAWGYTWLILLRLPEIHHCRHGEKTNSLSF